MANNNDARAEYRAEARSERARVGGGVAKRMSRQLPLRPYSPRDKAHIAARARWPHRTAGK